MVEAARTGELTVCTTVSILSEVYAALTWVNAQPPHLPNEAAEAVRLLVAPPSAITVLEGSLPAALKMLELAKPHNLTARRIHDARHAAMALIASVTEVYTYDIDDWKFFEDHGLRIAGPISILTRLSK